MDVNSNKDCDVDNTKALNGLDSPKGILILNGKRDEEEDDESKTLLPKKGCLAKKVGKPRMKVQWNDKNGDKLAEILEFQPSDVSDSDDEESDSCICGIM